MGQMQDKILAELRRTAECCELDFVRQPDAANTGLVFVQRGFETVLKIRYDFQVDYATIWYSGQWHDPQIMPAAGRNDGLYSTEASSRTLYISYDKAGEIRAMLDLFTALLAAHVTVITSGEEGD